MFKKQSNFNKSHPEIREGEVFLTNTDAESSPFYNFDDEGYHRIGWKTKRRGVIAYDIEGNVVDYLVPVFVQRDELINAGIDPDHLFEDR